MAYTLLFPFTAQLFLCLLLGLFLVPILAMAAIAARSAAFC
jgi:hypothetical protein